MINITKAKQSNVKLASNIKYTFDFFFIAEAAQRLPGSPSVRRDSDRIHHPSFISFSSRKPRGAYPESPIASSPRRSHEHPRLSRKHLRHCEVRSAARHFGPKQSPGRPHDFRPEPEPSHPTPRENHPLAEKMTKIAEWTTI